MYAYAHLYVPAGHASHAPPSERLYPARQLHRTLLDFGEYELAGQLVHALAPTEEEYEPTPQMRHHV